VTATLLIVLALAQPAKPTIVAPSTSYDGRFVIRFTSRERGVPHARLRFRCAFDKRPFRRCSSPLDTRLSVGTHTFRVQATDARGRRSPIASMTLVVAAPAPSFAVGREPVSVAYSAGSIWSADYGGGTVTRLDAATGRKFAPVDVGGSPGGIAIGAGYVWVGNFDERVGVTIVDPATNAIVGRLTGVGEVVALLVNGEEIWMADYNGFVIRVDAGTRATLARIAVGGNPEALAAGFGRIWASNYDGSVSAIDAQTNRTVGRIGGDSDMDAVTTTGAAVWATSLYGKTLLQIDPQSNAVVRRIVLPGQGAGVVAVGNLLWVPLYDSDLVVAVDGASGAVVRRVRAGSQPRDTAFDGANVWVADQGSNAVSKIATG
jgi:glutamine cyclotransferase